MCEGDLDPWGNPLSQDDVVVEGTSNDENCVICVTNENEATHPRPARSHLLNWILNHYHDDECPQNPYN